MYVPQTFSMALLMTISSAVCWGSWANTFKGTRGFRFELFYRDYALGIALAVACCCVFAWHEFRGAGTAARVNLGLMFVFFIAVIALVSWAYAAGG